ncbi:MAG: stage II sporulation protein P [Oscillospiraceae bacterium]|nr:stage II sporulation protein P [Oscillospiraceae bacterium]
MEQKVLRVSTLVVVSALLLRLLGGFLPILPSQAVSVILFLQTGRLVRPGNITFTPDAADPPELTPPPTDATQPEQQNPEQALPVFSAGDASLLAINSSFRYEADLPALLTQPLTWELAADAPTVLILHSHGSESYAPTGEYAEISPYHTLENDHNMISVGEYIAQRLEAAGISVLHDTALHDQPSYNAAYNNSRESARQYLEQYPSIQLVLDLHRDSIEDAAGNQVVQTVFAGDQTLAPLMLVVGTDYSGLDHPQWRENLSLALKLQTQLEGLCPGICRNINLRTQRFNQDLSPGALLIEVGSSGNSRQEALRSAGVLAEAILSLAHGSA